VTPEDTPTDYPLQRFLQIFARPPLEKKARLPPLPARSSLCSEVRCYRHHFRTVTTHTLLNENKVRVLMLLRELEFRTSFLAPCRASGQVHAICTGDDRLRTVSEISYKAASAPPGYFRNIKQSQEQFNVSEIQKDPL
jgi:hypothetical protein